MSICCQGLIWEINFLFLFTLEHCWFGKEYFLGKKLNSSIFYTPSNNVNKRLGVVRHLRQVLGWGEEILTLYGSDLYKSIQKFWQGGSWMLTSFTMKSSQIIFFAYSNSFKKYYLECVTFHSFWSHVNFFNFSESDVFFARRYEKISSQLFWNVLLKSLWQIYFFKFFLFKTLHSKWSL